MYSSHSSHSVNVFSGLTTDELKYYQERIESYKNERPKLNVTRMFNIPIISNREIPFPRRNDLDRRYVVVRIDDFYNFLISRCNILEKYKVDKVKDCECGLCGENSSDAMYKLECGHIFHQNCDVKLDNWIEQCKKDDRVPTCPMCRYEIK